MRNTAGELNSLQERVTGQGQNAQKPATNRLQAWGIGQQ